MLSFKKFLELKEMTDPVSKILGLGISALVGAVGGHRKMSHSHKKDVISHQTDTLEKTRNKEDKKNFKKFRNWNKKNVSNWKKSYGPDKIKSSSDYDPRPPSDIDLSEPSHASAPPKKKRKSQTPWRSPQHDHDVLDQIFGPEKK